MRKHRIAAIGGDGIGPEVISAGLDVITALSDKLGGFQIEAQSFGWGSELYRKTGEMMPADGVDRLREFDAIFFGAVGAPDIADHITLWELRLAICQGLDQYANVRPTKLLPGMRGPLLPELGAQIDWVIVRENSEGEYAGVGGRAHAALPLELAMDVSVFTRAGIERIARYACELAMKRPRMRLTVVTKSNAQRHGMVLWDQVCREVLADYPALQADFMLVDAMAAKMVTSPGTYDTILATNLHADILSDLASALTGSLGNGATANLNPSGDAPSMFEPIHGSAFDITGKGIANPIGAFWTAAMMLNHLGEKQASDVLMEAIGSVCQSGPHTPDMGGPANTAAVTQAVIQAIKEARIS